MPLWDILNFEWQHYGPWKLLFGGVPASLLYLVLDLGRNLAVEFLCGQFTLYLLRPTTSRDRKRRVLRVVNAVEKMSVSLAFHVHNSLEC